MPHAAAARTTRTTVGPLTVVLVVVMTAIIGIFINRSATAAEPAFREGIPRADHRGATIAGDGAVTEEDGVLADGVTVFDDAYAGIANLDPGLLQALRDAASAAADDDVELVINSGWRSAEYQDRLLREAVSKYGSEAEAARWVATADTSPHVAGDAVDVGSAEAATWLSKHGAEYGLCQIYRNEPWHYELRPEAIEGRCPRMYADPTRDPRLRR